MRTTATKSGVQFFTHGDYIGPVHFSVAVVKGESEQVTMDRSGRAYAKVEPGTGHIEVSLPMSAIYELVAEKLKQDLFIKLNAMDPEKLLKAVVGA